MTRGVKAVVFDWAGTTVDFGCQAPARVFQAIFEESGIPISVAQAREPMGKAKREHIQAIAYSEDVSDRWQQKFGSPPGEADIDRLYAHFLPLQKEVLAEHCDLIPDTACTVLKLRSAGIAIGSSTGYTRELMDVVEPAAEAAGYKPDVSICADDVEFGRPKPWIYFEVLRRLDVFPAWATVKVDDTPVGMQAAKNAGAWTVAVLQTGNELGWTLQELQAAAPETLTKRTSEIKQKFEALGVDYAIESIAELPAVIDQINQRLIEGELPVAMKDWQG